MLISPHPRIHIMSKDSTESNDKPNTQSDDPAENDATGDESPDTNTQEFEETNAPQDAVPVIEEKQEAIPEKTARARQGGMNKGVYGALIATVGVAAFFAGLSVPVLNSDPITMSDLEQAVMFLEDKIDTLSDDLQEIEDRMLTEPQGSTTATQPPLRISADDDPVMGSSNAPLLMIEFSDFQCPFCARFHSETLPLIKENYIDTGIVKMVYRDFPLENIHPNAVAAAVASECAHDQDTYWPYHDILFERIGEWGSLTQAGAVEQFKAYATDLSLELETFSECLDTGKHTNEVSNDFNDGRAYGITGTPAFFIGNDQIGYYPLSGARPYSEFQFAFEQLLSLTSQ